MPRSRLPGVETAALPLRVIGTLESCFPRKFGSPRQGHLVPDSMARLRLRPELIPEHALRGLEGFSHVWLLSYLHLCTNKGYRPTVHPPRLEGKTVGLFASRSPHRPSPVGLTLARLRAVEGGTLLLSGVDLADGTPILDVKPYLPACDRPAKARTGWPARLPARELSVRMAPGVRRALRGLREPAEARRLERLLRQVLRQDHRNPRDRSQMRPGKVLELFIEELLVEFSIDGKAAVVLGVRRDPRRPGS